MAETVLKTIIQIRRDTEASWIANKGAVLEAGEPALTIDGERAGQVKYGDGVTDWEHLPYSGDLIPVNAENVYFAQDLILTKPFGRYEPVNGQVTVPAEGQNLLEVLLDAYAEDAKPKITQPAVSLTSAQVKAYEVGTSVTPAYSASLNPGAYEYGPATGVTASSWSVTDTAGGSRSASSGSFDAFVVGDDTNYTMTATAAYQDGAVPKTALGQPYPAGQIKAGSKSATKGNITGYRNGFYGTLETKDGAVDSALVRSLTGKSNRSPSAGNVWNLAIPVGVRRIAFAYPATIRDVSSVQDVNGMNAEIKTAFTKSTVSVEGANGYTAIDYKVYVMDLAAANATANTYKVTL